MRTIVEARKLECEESNDYFTRYFFKQRTGAKMLIGRHHPVIHRTLERVIDGEIKRLIINIPPGYTKTEIASISLMARGLAINEHAKFMHLSYSDKLALLNSSTARSIVRSKDYQSMWPMKPRDDADSKHMWWNQYGGGVYAASTMGQVTGFRAGLMTPEGQPWRFTGALIIDDPVKPRDALYDNIRDAVNDNYSDTIKSRLADEDVPVIVIMQRIHYKDLSGHLLRGGSGEKWHHLNLPVKIDNSKKYPQENTHGIPIDHGLSDGWLWEAKHSKKHLGSLMSHKRTWNAQYLQEPKKFDADGALWTESMIAMARKMPLPWAKKRTVIGVDPATTNEENSDEWGIGAASSYANDKYSVDGDYTRKMSPADAVQAIIEAYNRHEADAVVVETNQGGKMVEELLRNAKFKGRIINVHASKSKFSRAEPIAALYEKNESKENQVHHAEGLDLFEDEIMEYVPLTAKKSPNRLDWAVWALTELTGGNLQAGGF
jgi:hypothetical protein